jgi:HSP20 family protein
MFGLIPRRGSKAAPREEEHPLALLRREFSSLFNRFFGGLPEVFEPAECYWGLEFEELDREVVLRVEVPGFAARDLDVKIVGEMLTIRAESKEEKAEAAGRVMERTVMLPPGVDPGKVEALYRNGVLEVRLPRKPELLPRKIEVKT